MRGASASIVRAALETGDPLPGTFGFAGTLADGTIVRDVLGRRPLFVDDDSAVTASDPAVLSNPESFPAGHASPPGEVPRRVFSLPSPTPASGETDALAAIRSALDTAFDALETAIPNDASPAVAFSGGLDSALVASRVDAPCYVVGYEGSTDLETARDAADTMGLDLTVCELSLRDIEDAVPTVARAIDRTNAMDVQIALPLFLVASRIAADGFDHVLLGQGADELFAGYAKVANAPDDHRVDADSVRGARREVLETLPDQLERDVLAIRAAGAEPVTPLLHDAVVDAALRLPAELLVRDGVRKVALRSIARESLPGDVADREKKAVQYGSLVAREVDRLARRAGFKRRMDDHVRRYVEARLDETDR